MCFFVPLTIGAGIVYGLEKKFRKHGANNLLIAGPAGGFLTEADTAFLRSNFSFRRMKSF
jgi:hypothetical protein